GTSSRSSAGGRASPYPQTLVGNICLAALCQSGTPCPNDLPRQPEHNYSPDKGDDDRRHVHPRGAGVAKVVEDPSAGDGTDDPDHQISERTPGSLTRNHHLRQPPRDDPNDYP